MPRRGKNASTYSSGRMKDDAPDFNRLVEDLEQSYQLQVFELVVLVVADYFRGDLYAQEGQWGWTQRKLRSIYRANKSAAMSSDGLSLFFYGETSPTMQVFKVFEGRKVLEGAVDVRFDVHVSAKAVVWVTNPRITRRYTSKNREQQRDADLLDDDEEFV